MYFSDVRFNFKEPLRKVLRADRLCPFVVVNVKSFFLFSFSLRFWGFFFPFCTFCCFWLFWLYWPLQVKLLFNAVLLFRHPYSQIPDIADIFLYPVEILTCQSLFFVAMMADDNVSLLTFIF